MILQVKACSHGVVWKLHWYAVIHICFRSFVRYQNISLYRTFAIKRCT